MIHWRFDQGRLDYLQFDEIRTIAQGLAAFDGVGKPGKGTPDLLRETLSKYSSLPFSPSHYFVWRNYGRVFGSILLASVVADVVRATDLCKRLATGSLTDSDDYFAHLATTFYYPSPAFEEYDPSSKQIFPAIALIKLLSSRLIDGKPPLISLDEVASYLIGNQVTGLEPLAFYSTLKPSKYEFEGSEDRQAREFIVFISQFSFLKWSDDYLILDVADKKEAVAICGSLVADVNARLDDPGLEIQRLGSGALGTSVSSITTGMVESLEIEFTEGAKTRVTHLRTERSRELKKLFFDTVDDPSICDMCDIDTALKYPWATHVIELHHLLPLSSPIRVEKGKTSLKDIVGLCPTCHRATHKYYSIWLKKGAIADFKSYGDARAVYEEVCVEVVLT